MASKRRARRRPEGGFTLIEIMIVCAIITILAILVVPMFMEESVKTKSRAEVNAFFAEIQTRQENFKMDNNGQSYFPFGGGTSTKCPTAPTETGSTFDCHIAGGAWQGGAVTDTLNVAPPSTTPYCAYQITSGAGGAAGQPAPFTMVTPAGTWYFIVAECDADGDGAFSTYFVSSVNSTIQADNEGD
jgi:prepilin-type N-terminal cleavage/methylation domain-containing protein